MTILKDLQGNVIDDLNAVNGKVITDNRPNTSNVGILNSEIFIDVTKEEYASVDVRGVFIASLITEFTVNGVDFIALPVFNRIAESFSAAITAVGVYQFEIPTGTKRIRIRCSNYTSGSAVVALTANVGKDMQYCKNIPSNLQVTATGIASTAVTLTLPAVAGLFHYITQIKIEKFASALLTPGATPIIVTTNNLAGSRAYSIDASAQAQGTIISSKESLYTPIKSTTAGTATTIICPISNGVIWRVSVDYYLGF
jgi:hypothetical protein